MAQILSNEELVDHLVMDGYIWSRNVEKVLRAVDRAFYFPSEFQKDAYRMEGLWHDFYQLPSPGLNAVVLGKLELEQGQSFLVIGSGCGDINTLAGLILGPWGKNYGIETNKSFIKYAKEKLEEFKKKSSAFDVFEFCEPQFSHVAGDGFRFRSNYQFDRIYASKNTSIPNYLQIMKYLKVGGILIARHNTSYYKYVKISEHNKDCKLIYKKAKQYYGTAFQDVPKLETRPTPLPVPKEFHKQSFQTLSKMCRTQIRNTIRNASENNNKSLKDLLKHQSGAAEKETFNGICPIYRDLSGNQIQMWEYRGVKTLELTLELHCQIENQRIAFADKYRSVMEKIINDLQIPHELKVYLNNDRDFIYF